MSRFCEDFRIFFVCRIINKTIFIPVVISGWTLNFARRQVNWFTELTFVWQRELLWHYTLGNGLFIGDIFKICFQRIDKKNIEFCFRMLNICCEMLYVCRFISNTYKDSCLKCCFIFKIQNWLIYLGQSNLCLMYHQTFQNYVAY